ncbi:MAG: LURP-one-related/scramblase family protein [Acetanaerobacterium sp.]
MTLYIKQKFFSLGDKFSITDQNSEPVFEVVGQIFAIGAKLHLYDMLGRELYYVEQKVFRFLPQYYIYEQGTQCAVVNKEFTFFRPSLSVSSSYGDLRIDGDFFSMSFSIYLNGGLIGAISKEFFSFTDFYRLDIPDGTNAAFFCALVIAIDNCLHNGDRSGR